MEIDNGRKYEEAIKIHSEVVKTMDNIGYGLLKDGETFYRYGTEPKDGITFSLRKAYEIRRILTETDQQARESERERLGMGGMLMVGNYCGKAIMLAGGDAEMANRFIKEVIEPAILSNPPSQV